LLTFRLKSKDKKKSKRLETFRLESKIEKSKHLLTFRLEIKDKKSRNINLLSFAPFYFKIVWFALFLLIFYNKMVRNAPFYIKIVHFALFFIDFL
jgi:hypothetical protein